MVRGEGGNDRWDKEKNAGAGEGSGTPGAALRTK